MVPACAIGVFRINTFLDVSEYAVRPPASHRHSIMNDFVQWAMYVPFTMVTFIDTVITVTLCVYLRPAASGAKEWVIPMDLSVSTF